MPEPPESRRGGAPWSVAIVGLGNIGSHLVSHVCRLPGLERLVLVDSGRYDPGNLTGQAIARRDVGRQKARVQSLRARQVNPRLDVKWAHAAVEDVPLGHLRADVVLACVDSRAARNYLNQAARRLGVAWIDAGVHADALLARVSVFSASPDDACLACTWDQADYDLIEQVKPCQGEASEAPPTGATAHLGALAAAWQAIECERLLAAGSAWSDGSYEVIISAGSHRVESTRLARTAACRLPDHAPWQVRTTGVGPSAVTVAQAFSLVPDLGPSGRISVDGVPFVTRLVCLGCGDERRVFLLRRATKAARRCRRCGGRVVASGAHLRASLGRDALEELANRPLLGIGMRPGDVFAVRDDEREMFFELGGDDGHASGGESR